MTPKQKVQKLWRDPRLTPDFSKWWFVSEAAAREVRTRINEGCCHTHDQDAVKVRKIARAALIRPRPKRCKPQECY